MARNEYDQKDSDVVTRDRTSRATIAFLAPISVAVLGYVAGVGIASFFNLPGLVGTAAGLGLAALGALSLIPRVYVMNDAVAAFVTVDLLTKQLVTYGPGFHFSFPWEARDGANNVGLGEVEEKFTFVVQTKTGTLHGKGSVRLRPDITRLPEFLAGAGSVAADVTDLISATLVKYLADYSVKEALLEMKSIKALLTEEFKHGPTQAEPASEFEKRFGVMIGDVTVSELLPSKEVQKAMDGASENAALEEIIARSLGKSTMAEVHAAVADKQDPLTSEHVTAATKLAMAMTDNLHGMDFKDHNFNLKISGDPELAQALGALAPAAAAFISRNQSKGKK